jgi:hypothetical protein
MALTSDASGFRGSSPVTPREEGPPVSIERAVRRGAAGVIDIYEKDLATDN